MPKIDLGRVIGKDFVYDDFTQAQLEALKVKGDAGDNKVIVVKDGVQTREDLTLKKEGKFTKMLTGDTQENHKLLVDDVLTEDGNPIMDMVKQFSNPNLLINGDCQVRQRGDTFDYSSSTLSKRLYTFDRWSVGSGSKNFKITYGNGCRIQNTVVGSYFELANICENNLKIGDVVTLSLKIMSNKDFTMKQRIGVSGTGNNNVDINIKQGTHIYILTSTIKAEDVAINQIGIFALFGYADVLFDITVEWAKLELGTITTPFVPRLYAEELALCQRYFEKKWVSMAGNSDLPKTLNYIISVNTWCVPKRIKGYSTRIFDIANTLGKCSRLTIGNSAVMGQPARIYIQDTSTFELISDSGAIANGVIGFVEADAEIY